MHARKHEAPMSNDTRFALLESAVVNINSSLLDIKQQMNANLTDIKQQMNDVRQQINRLDDKMDKKFDGINNRLWFNFLWFMGMIIGLAGLIAHAQHWI